MPNSLAPLVAIRAHPIDRIISPDISRLATTATPDQFACNLIRRAEPVSGIRRAMRRIFLFLR